MVTTVSLSKQQKRQAVNLSLQAAVLGLHHAPNIHYTQGSKRWEGIEDHRLAYRGQYPNYADCSAYVTWCLWNGLNHFHIPDVVNGEHWKGGFTGTMLEHGKRVRTPIPGDAIIYGNGGTGEHTALYTGGGLVVSHGSEAGPLLLPWRYRSDVMSIRRYI